MQPFSPPEPSSLPRFWRLASSGTLVQRLLGLTERLLWMRAYLFFEVPVSLAADRPLPAGVSVTRAEGEEIQRVLKVLPRDYPDGWIEESLRRDACYVLRCNGEPAAMCWLAREKAQLGANLYVHLPPSRLLVHSSYVRDRYRGQRLHSLMRLHSAAAERRSGEDTLVFAAAWRNRNALLSNQRMPAVCTGTVVTLAKAGRQIQLAGRGLRRRAFRFSRRRADAEGPLPLAVTGPDSIITT